MSRPAHMKPSVAVIGSACMASSTNVAAMKVTMRPLATCMLERDFRCGSAAD